MREKDLHKYIIESDAHNNDILADSLRKRHPEIKQNTATSTGMSLKKPFAKRIAIFVPLVTAAFLAIVLIPTLLLHTGKTVDEPNDNQHPIDEYVISQLDYTVKEYNEINGTNFLYFDWNNVSNYTAIKYINNKTEAFLGLRVSFYNTDTDDNIEYTVCSDDSSLDFLAYNISICTNEKAISKYSVKWATANENSYGIFNYDNYNYYITLKNNSDETRLFELIGILLDI